MKYKIFFFVFTLILLNTNVSAQTDKINTSQSISESNIYGSKIYIPSPNNFHEINESSPRIYKLALQLTAPINRLLKLYISHQDYERNKNGESVLFDRYMKVETIKSIENDIFTTNNFSKLSSQMKKQQVAIYNEVMAKIGVPMDKAMKEISNDYNIAVTMKTQSFIPLGLFLDEKNAVGFASLVRYKGSIGNKSYNYIIIGSSIFVLLNNKVVLLYIFSKYNSEEDITWVKSISKEWLDSIVSSNNKI